MAQSWKAQFKVFNDPNYYDNALRFATQLEATMHAADKLSAWSMAEDSRVVESDDPPNYAWSVATGLIALPSPTLPTPVKLSDLPGGTPLTVTWRTE